MYIATNNEYTMTPIKELIEKLELQPHPEGGYFKETYRSAGEINKESLGSEYDGKRNYSTCIYFLMTSDNFSSFHKVNQDEIWHFYEGSPIRLHVISEKGGYSEYKIGRNFSKGEVPQLVVPGGYWFAAEVAEKDSYSLVGCTVAPGFDFADFQLPSRSDLVAKYPQHEKLITRLTHQ